MWVRTASPGDVEDISRLLGVVWHATYDDIYGTDRVEEITREWHAPDVLANNLNIPAAEFLVADNGKQIGGMAYARQVDEKTAKIQQIYILPEFQGQGVGQQLLDEMFESFFDISEFELEVEEKNVSAIGFYERNGFYRVGVTENCGEENSGIPALIYRKNR